jgi:predicted metal-dependent enzyme (double-stranded beta helix superfamily)
MTSELSRALMQTMGNEAYSGAMARVADRFAGYRRRLPAVPHAYSRTRLALTPEYEIVAMNWAPQSTSPIHDHGESRCWVLMLDGVLEVQNFTSEECEAAEASLRDRESIVLHRGDIDHRFGPAELHRVTNPSFSESAFSLQLYAAPLTTYSVVDARTRMRRLVTATCELEFLLD